MSLVVNTNEHIDHRISQKHMDIILNSEEKKKLEILKSFVGIKEKSLGAKERSRVGLSNFINFVVLGPMFEIFK